MCCTVMWIVCFIKLFMFLTNFCYAENCVLAKLGFTSIPTYVKIFQMTSL